MKEKREEKEVFEDVKRDIEKTDFFTIKELCKNHGVKDWEEAGFLRLFGWTKDRKLTEKEFSEKINQYRIKRIGGK
ncbi:MAG TPA: hypothetical protein PK771_01975 [Spirochaetota bacterium]|nr:hypothetical protein [Spirochaetota bacterium]